MIDRSDGEAIGIGRISEEEALIYEPRTQKFLEIQYENNQEGIDEDSYESESFDKFWMPENGMVTNRYSSIWMKAEPTSWPQTAYPHNSRRRGRPQSRHKSSICWQTQ